MATAYECDGVCERHDGVRGRRVLDLSEQPGTYRDLISLNPVGTATDFEYSAAWDVPGDGDGERLTYGGKSKSISVVSVGDPQLQ